MVGAHEDDGATGSKENAAEAAGIFKSNFGEYQKVRSCSSPPHPVLIPV